MGVSLLLQVRLGGDDVLALVVRPHVPHLERVARPTCAQATLPSNGVQLDPFLEVT